MTALTFPVGLLVDDTGAFLTAPVVTVASVTDKSGAAVSSPGVVVNGSGAAGPISFDFDADAKGPAWVTLAVSQAPFTVTGRNARIALFAHAERSQVAAMLGGLTDADVTLAPDTLTGTMSVYASGLPHIAGNLLYTVALSRSSTGQPFSFDRA